MEVGHNNSNVRLSNQHYNGILWGRKNQKKEKPLTQRRFHLPTHCCSWTNYYCFTTAVASANDIAIKAIATHCISKLSSNFVGPCCQDCNSTHYTRRSTRTCRSSGTQHCHHSPRGLQNTNYIISKMYIKSSLSLSLFGGGFFLDLLLSRARGALPQPTHELCLTCALDLTLQAP